MGSCKISDYLHKIKVNNFPFKYKIYTMKENNDHWTTGVQNGSS